MTTTQQWFESDMTLQEVIKKELSPPVYDKMDLAIYRGSVRLQERANHMRVLSEVCERANKM